MEIAFPTVEAPENSIYLYISAREEGQSHAPIPIHRETVQSHREYHEGGTSHVDADGNDTDDEEAVQDQNTINLNSIPEVLRAIVTSFERVAYQENLSPNILGLRHNSLYEHASMALPHEIVPIPRDHGVKATQTVERLSQPCQEIRHSQPMPTCML